MTRYAWTLVFVLAAGCGGAMMAKAASPASITNNQEAGVDEGGIVKAHGDHLIVLRRGRLFSVRVAGDQLVPVSRVDASPPHGDHDTWYDEMLVHDDTIIVVGYSYHAQATELGVFSIDAQGQLRHRSTYYLRSNDYYSSRNYAGRVVGDTLVFYMPYYIGSGDDRTFPAIRAYDADRDRWSNITRVVHGSVQSTSSPVLHTVVMCDLRARAMKDRGGLACNASGILGPAGRTFYVSPNAVYVWVSDANDAVIYRLSMRGGTPLTVRASGAPIDQFAFKETADALHVLVRAEGNGDWMWGPESSRGAVALLRVPLSSFGPTPKAMPRSAYRPLPDPGGYTMQNRFVGDHVLYGAIGGSPSEQGVVYAVPLANGSGPITLGLGHQVERIEAMGGDAVVIGSDGKNLHFTSIALAGTPTIVDDHVQPGASQGELRSHGFFYQPDDIEPDEGILGLPVRGGGEGRWSHLTEDSAAVVFLKVSARKFQPLGSLFARSREVDDHCVASCVDWYGNARPIFYRGRIFALLGYELVEGRIAGDRIGAVQRTNFLHPAAKRAVAAVSAR